MQVVSGIDEVRTVAMKGRVTASFPGASERRMVDLLRSASSSRYSDPGVAGAARCRCWLTSVGLQFVFVFLRSGRLAAASTDQADVVGPMRMQLQKRVKADRSGSRASGPRDRITGGLVWVLDDNDIGSGQIWATGSGLIVACRHWQQSSRDADGFLRRAMDADAAAAGVVDGCCWSRRDGRTRASRVVAFAVASAATADSILTAMGMIGTCHRCYYCCQRRRT
ncbi:hypothetical protein ACLOJK_007550, partial [Asimina triloba]